MQDAAHYEEMITLVEDKDADFGAGPPNHGSFRSTTSESTAASGHFCESEAMSYGTTEVRMRPRRPSSPAHARHVEESGAKRCMHCNGSGLCHASPDDGEADVVESLNKFWHRAGWLVMLLFCQSTSSVILEHFEILIKTHPVVIYFLTMLVGAGGNAGGQSTVLVVRRLALIAARGMKAERISMRQIVGAEVSLGARLALVLFFASFLRCIAFSVLGWECVAICLSMLVIVFTSTLVGAALPVFLSRAGIDPAHAGATIQVVMDISGVTLTCIVSCLVLGLPLRGGVASSMQSNSTWVATATVRSIHQGLISFGSSASAPSGTGQFTLGVGEA